ncbi:hypothetical protein [Rhodopirellula sp. MGV]|uniref:hypothetical protein n=1 Tax=Rhodopirellula sp. MGV TaxID=2023130 RepID=UPI000B96EE5D|nr:hypothetical protein [Rhodopirellula sp. MGV]PNY37591.1 hypothetical protein C2E31_06420 [Rhodopirellula baltica]
MHLSIDGSFALLCFGSWTHEPELPAAATTRFLLLGTTFASSQGRVTLGDLRERVASAGLTTPVTDSDVVVPTLSDFESFVTMFHDPFQSMRQVPNSMMLMSFRALEFQLPWQISF